MKAFIFYTLLLLTNFCFAQITGTWSGTLSQPGGPDTLYQFSINITEKNGVVTGTSTILTGPNFGYMRLKGKYSDNVLTFEEFEIIDQKRGNFSWCYKTAHLNISTKSNELRAVGPWNGYAMFGTYKSICPPGTIDLKKQIGKISLNGNIIDAQSKEQIPAKIKVVRAKDKKEISGLVTGTEYNISIPDTGLYQVVVEAPGYISIFESVKITESQNKNFELSKITVGQNVRLKNILFVKGTAVLTEDSYPEIDNLAKFLKENPTVEIELQGHTSNEGDQTKNMTLSKDRVETVKNH